MTNAPMNLNAYLYPLMDISCFYSHTKQVSSKRLPSEDEVFVEHSACYFHDSVTEKVGVDIS